MTMTIGLTGYAQTGKDTVGEILVRRGWHRIGFADNVRALALAADPLVPYNGNDDTRLSEIVAGVGWEEAKRDSEVRRFLQALGTGVRDVLGNGTWIDAALRELDDPTPSLSGVADVAGVVVTDVRHQNEAAAIRARGGFVVRVTRAGTGPLNQHETEVGVDRISVDALITNDGTVEELEEKVAGLLSTLEAIRSAV